MAKDKSSKFSLRINVLKKTNERIEVIQAQKRIEGTIMTKDSTVDYIVENFKEDKK